MCVWCRKSPVDRPPWDELDGKAGPSPGRPWSSCCSAEAGTLQQTLPLSVCGPHASLPQRFLWNRKQTGCQRAVDVTPCRIDCRLTFQSLRGHRTLRRVFFSSRAPLLSPDTLMVLHFKQNHHLNQSTIDVKSAFGKKFYSSIVVTTSEVG